MIERDESERFATLVPPYAPAMLRAAAALVGLADAEDAAQEAVIRAWQAWPSLRDETALRGWLLTITVNVCRQWRRGGFGRRLRLMEPLPEDDSRLLARIEGDPDARSNPDTVACRVGARLQSNGAQADPAIRVPPRQGKRSLDARRSGSGTPLLVLREEGFRSREGHAMLRTPWRCQPGTQPKGGSA